MFFIASKILSFLINPVTWISGVLLYALITRNNRRKKIAFISGSVLCLLLTNPLLCNLALRKLETPPKPKDELPLVNTAVVLSGMANSREYTEQLQFNESVERVEEAINLYHEGVIRKIILSGGSGELLDQEFSESKRLKEFVITRGIKPKDLIIEPNSKNTYQNAVETRKILDSLHLEEQPLLLITSAFHMKRSIRCFKKQGILHIPFPVDFRGEDFNWSLHWLVPSASALPSWQLIIKELIGTLVYQMTGYA